MITPDQCGPEYSRSSLGQIFATKCLQTLTQRELTLGLGRHLHCDWGDVDEYDRQANEHALENGERIFSVYRTSAGLKFYVITEANRSMTTILMAEDY